jgi:hypothetical protein
MKIDTWSKLGHPLYLFPVNLAAKLTKTNRPMTATQRSLNTISSSKTDPARQNTWKLRKTCTLTNDEIGPLKSACVHKQP